jgi:acyl-CoA thioesterase-1
MSVEHTATNRRGFVGAVLGVAALGRSSAFARARRVSGALTLVTFGDSILDCAHYNDRGIHPGQLIVENDNALFPAFAGRDLATCRPAALEHRARDGARVDGLAAQVAGSNVRAPAVAIVTIGGNDLLGGLAVDEGRGIARFERMLTAFLRSLPRIPVLLGNVYDPTFGDDSRNFLNVDPRIARVNLSRMNRVIADLAARHGELVDLHGHFLGGDASWYTHTIEPSLRGASEVRAAFLPAVLRAANCGTFAR